MDSSLNFRRDARADTPDPVVTKFNAAFNQVMADKDKQSRFQELGVKVSEPESSAAFAGFVAKSNAQWKEAIATAQIPRQ